MLLDGKTAVVTGAGRGIGRATARLFAAEGARVAIHYHNSGEAAKALALEIGGIALRADLTDPNAAHAIIMQAVLEFGRIDILVNNASSFAADCSFEKASWKDFENEFAGVVGVTVNPTHAVVPFMKAQHYGRIVNLMATLIRRPASQYIVHTTTKSALLGYSRTLARELGPFGITVNMVSPGMTLTDYSDALSEDVKEGVKRQTPLRRLATAEDVARTILFYASPLADMVTGAEISPDGGLAFLKSARRTAKK